MENLKDTMWTVLPRAECTFLPCDIPGSIRVKHPELKRVRFFVQSRNGNWYSRYTGKETERYALGYVIK